METSNLINRDLPCDCGRAHRCDIDSLEIGKKALECLPRALREYAHILIVADQNTYPLCGERVSGLLDSHVQGRCVFEGEGYLVPNEAAVARIEGCLTAETDFLLGIGSGVINDLCKYVSFFHKLKYGIVATATSMDGYASSGAAMILGGMKVTETTHVPSVIVGDVEVLCTAPLEMVQAGYADIIGKYSALNDWKLSRLITGEYFCPFLCNVVQETTDEIRDMAGAIAAREEAAIAKLMEALVLVGVCLTLAGSTRPGSGSEHHFSHYFEITGLIDHKPYFLHGIDVGYSTVVTAMLRRRILEVARPQFNQTPRIVRQQCYEAIYKEFAGEVSALQDRAGWYDRGLPRQYRAHWDEVLDILRQCPPADEINGMLAAVGMDFNRLEQMYGEEKIRRGVWFAKDLKDRYSVLWLYYSLFFTESESEKIYGKRDL